MNHKIPYVNPVFLCNPEKNTICNKTICQSGCRYTTHQQFAQLDKHGSPIQADIFKEGVTHERNH